MTATTTILVEVVIQNAFFTHRRQFEEIDEAIEFCEYLNTKTLTFSLFDPEIELSFCSDDLPSIEEYYDLEEYDQRKIWFLMDEIDKSLAEALECCDDVYHYENYDNVAGIMESQVQDGYFGSICDELVDFNDYYRMADQYGDAYFDTQHGIFSYS